MKAFIPFLVPLFLSSASANAPADYACPGSRSNEDGVIFGDYGDGIVYYFDGFPDCPKPQPGDKDYYCWTRPDAVKFDDPTDSMVVTTTPWFGGGFRMGCMKKDVTTGWQCAAQCGIGTNNPRISDWGFLTFDLKISTSNSCTGRVKFVKKWPTLSSEYVELTGDYVDGTPDGEGWHHVIIPTHDFKTCDWMELDNARDLIFENCASGGQNPTYEVRNIVLTNQPAHPFTKCHCDCQVGSHDIFANTCSPPTTATPPAAKFVFKEACDLSAEAGGMNEFFLDVPNEASDLYCKTWGGTGNVGLLLNWDDWVNSFQADTNTCASNVDGCNNVEECSGNMLFPYGDKLYIGVYGNEVYDGVCVTCAYKIPHGVQSPALVKYESEMPSAQPTQSPKPSMVPSATPSEAPTGSSQPSGLPSPSPTAYPTESAAPSQAPTNEFGTVAAHVPEFLSFSENDTVGLVGFDVEYLDGRVPRSDETLCVEILAKTLPTGTRIKLGGKEKTPNWEGYYEIEKKDIPNLSIDFTNHYSGRFTMSCRAVLREQGRVRAWTDPALTVVDVLPIADGVRRNTFSVVEDQGVIDFGSLTNAVAALIDNGTGNNNNRESERVIEVRVRVPPSEIITIEDATFGSLSAQATSTNVGDTFITYSEGADHSTYVIRSSLLPAGATSAKNDLIAFGFHDWSKSMPKADADIRQTLASLQLSLSRAHDASDPDIRVTFVTADFNPNVRDGSGDVDTKESTWNPMKVLAVADTPGLTVIEGTPACVDEDSSTNVPLKFTVNNSSDEDNSEVVLVQVVVPTALQYVGSDEFLTPIGDIIYNGVLPMEVSMTEGPTGVWTLSASGSSNPARQDSLNLVTENGLLQFQPRDGYSSPTSANLTIRVIATEVNDDVADGSAGGADGTAATELVAGTMTVCVDPIADVPTVVVKGNALGGEDLCNYIEIEVTLNDPDRSETFIMEIDDTLPPSTLLYADFDCTSNPLVAANGVYTLSPQQLNVLKLVPPLHYSSAVQGDILLSTTVIVSDGPKSTATASLPVALNIRGIADAPAQRQVTVAATEDVDYDLSVLNVPNILIDTDGSESLSFRLANLPAGVFPYSANPSDIVPDGIGSFNIRPDALATLRLPAGRHYAGEHPYGGRILEFVAVVQEIDGSEAESEPWTIDFKISPVADGFAKLDPKIAVLEDAATGVPLEALLSNYELADSDGSEVITEIVFDMTNLITDAQIGQQVKLLTGLDTVELDDVVVNYLSGTEGVDYVYNSATGRITVTETTALSNMVLSSELFVDSNVDFQIPFAITVVDSAGGMADQIVQEGDLEIRLKGVADIPTVFSNNAIGPVLSLVPVSLGGSLTDRDASLGRLDSETLSFVVTEEDAPADYFMIFTDQNGNAVGLDRGGVWLLTRAEIEIAGGLHVYSPQNIDQILNLSIVAVATENDGSITHSQKDYFTVTFTKDAGQPDASTNVLPNPGSLTFLTPLDCQNPCPTPSTYNIGMEGQPLVLNVDVGPGDVDTLVSVTIGGVPSGWTIEGAFYNPLTDEYSASADDWNAGAVICIPKVDFSGLQTLDLTVETVSTTTGVSVTSGTRTMTTFFDPVANGGSISFGPTTINEDGPLIASASFDFAYGETLYSWTGPTISGQWFYINFFSHKATFTTAGYSIVLSTDDDAKFLDSTSLVGYYRIPYSARSTLVVDLLENWHGTIKGKFVAPIIAQDRFATIGDGPDDDDYIVSTADFTISVIARADHAVLTAPEAPVLVNEDVETVIPGLSVALADLVTDNGSEYLTAYIEGVPAGTRFNAGILSGGGKWVFPNPAAEFPSLTITPPEQWSGTMDLTLGGLVMESSNGDSSQVTASFSVIVEAVADSLEIVARHVDILTSPSDSIHSELEIRSVDEEEYMTVVLSQVPTGIRYLAGSGGRLTTDGLGTWTMIGTLDQVNDLYVVTGPNTMSIYDNWVEVSVTSHDGASSFGPITDSLRIAIDETDSVSQVVHVDGNTQTATGGAGNDVLLGDNSNDTLSGGAGHDMLIGGPGADTMTGGFGSDVFAWSLADLDLAVTDVITDFQVGTDVLDLCAVFDEDGQSYNPQIFNVNDMLELSSDGVLSVKLSSGTVPVVRGIVGAASVDVLFHSGSILV